MRIAILSDKYPPDAGGLAISARRLARSLAHAGHTVHVLAPSTTAAPGQIVAALEDGVAVERIGASRRSEDTLADWLDAVRAAHARAPFDVLHAYYLAGPAFVAVYAGHLLGVPSVVSARGNDLDRAAFDPARAGHILHALAHASAVTANAADLAAKAGALAPSRRVTLIPNGVDATLFAPAAPDPALRAALGLDSRPLIGFVGEARAKKGLACLLMAYRTLARSNPLALALVGGVRVGEDAELVAVFRRQNPDLPLIVVPYQPAERLPTYYNLLDVLVLPSVRDGLPNALLEGMACSRAVAAANVGGIPDVVRDGENALLFVPNDVGACAAAVARLLADPDLRRRLGEAARATVTQHFTPERELAANLEVYRQVIAGVRW